MKVVQEILGHADIALTLNTYSHVMLDIQERATEAMASILG
jgi:site-specific recombinase XerD